MSLPPNVRGDLATRSQLIGEVRDRLNRGSPRLQLLLIVVLAGTAAFLTSVAGLALNLTSMSARYALATAVGYLAFIGLIRAWS